LVEAELKKEEGEAIALNSIEGVSQTNVTLFLNFCIQYIFDLNAKFYFEDFNFSILYGFGSKAILSRLNSMGGSKFCIQTIDSFFS
jgi:hypothetical protein